MFSIENFIVGLKKVLRNARIEDREKNYTLIKMYERPDLKGPEEMEVGKLEKEELLRCSQWFSSKTNFNGSSLYNAEIYESAIKPQDRGRVMPYAQLKRLINKIEVDKDGNVDIYLRLIGDLGLDETVLIEGDKNREEKDNKTALNCHNHT